MEQLGFDLGYAFDEPTTSKGGGMRIVQADFVSAKHKTFEEIFYNGKYDTLHAITFSSSFELIYEAAKRFKYIFLILNTLVMWKMLSKTKHLKVVIPK